MGRAEENDLVVKGNLISRLHARIEMSRNKFMLIDQSTNGTFVRAGGKWEEIKEPRVISHDAELMLGDYQTTPRLLFSESVTVLAPAGEEKKKYRPTAPEATPPPLPTPRRAGPRRNEFGEIIHE